MNLCRHCNHLGDPCPAHERDAESRADARSEPDDDTREPGRDYHYPREFGAVLTAGGW